MGISIAHQTQAFFCSILIGTALGLLYDIFRIVRIALPSPKLLVAAQDILYFLLASGITCLFTLNINEGEVRSFVLVGELLGWIFYFFTIGTVVMAVSRKVIAAVKAVLAFLWKYLLRPVLRLLGKILHILAMPLRFFPKKLKKVSAAGKYSLKQSKIMLYNLIKSQKAS